MTPEEALRNFIDEEVQLFATDTYQRLLQSMNELKVRNVTGNLRNTLRATVLKATSDYAAGMQLHMASYGTIMATRTYSKKFMPPVDEIKKWVQAVGVNNFKNAGGKSLGKNATNQQLLNRIAWGIAIKRTQTVKRTGLGANWFYPEFYGPLKGWRNSLIDKYTQLVADNIVPKLQ